MADCGNANGYRRPISPDLIKQLNHPIRRELLRLLHKAQKPQSPLQMSVSFAEAHDLQNIAYHVRVLEKGGLVRQVSERPVRGVSERFVISLVADHPQISVILADTAEDDGEVRSKRQVG